MVSKPLGTLESVELRLYWPDEAQDFTPWLAEATNLSLLSSTLGMDLELEHIEVPVGPFKCDIVAHDVSSGAKVIVENQLEKTDHDHLGKTITYASGLDATVIIWIAREFAEEHRRAIDYPNELAAPKLRFFGIEMRLWRIGDSPAAPQFTVVSSPNDFALMVTGKEGNLTESDILYLNFWSGFKDYCSQHGTTLRLRAPRPQTWYGLALGPVGFSLSLSCSLQKRRFACEIYIEGPTARQAFKLLLSEKDAIEQATGPLTWQNPQGNQYCRIARSYENIDIAQESTWETAHQWLKGIAEQLYTSFAPRIKALPVLFAASEVSQEDLPLSDGDDA